MTDVFARAARESLGVKRANGAAAVSSDPGGSPASLPSPVPEGPLITGVAGGGDTSDSAPSALVCPVIPLRPNLNWEHYAWQPDPAA